MRKTVKMPSFSNVGAGQTATLSCPVGLTYDLITLSYSGKKEDGTTDMTLSDIQNLEVIVNGKTIQSFKTASELNMINVYHGRKASENGFITLWFIRPELAAVRDQRVTAIGTVDVQTFSIHADLEGTLTSVSLSAKAIQSEPQYMGAITKVKAFPASFATSGEHEIDSIPRSGAQICCMHLFKADISNVEMEVNGIKVFDSSKAYAEEMQKQYGKVPQSSDATHIDFILEGDLAQSLETTQIKDMRIRPEIDTSGALRVVVEYIDGFAGI